MVWELRDGRRVDFWLNRWIPTEQTLYFNLTKSDMILYTILMIKDVVDRERKSNQTCSKIGLL